MKKYHVLVANQAHQSIRDIVKHKLEYSDDTSWAMEFADGLYADLEVLEFFPHRGSNISGWYKARSYKSHLIVYRVIEPDSVRVLDVVDPRQHTVAGRYFS